MPPIDQPRHSRRYAWYVVTLLALAYAFSLLALIVRVPATLAGAASTPAGTTALLHMAPGDYRARLTSVYMIFINGFGLLLGPSLVGALNDHVFGTAGVRHSMAVVSFIVGGIQTTTMLFGPRAYRAAVQHRELRQLQGVAA